MPRAAASRSKWRTAAPSAASATSVSAAVTRATDHTPPISASAIRSAASAFILRRARIRAAEPFAAAAACRAVASSAANSFSDVPVQQTKKARWIRANEIPEVRGCVGDPPEQVSERRISLDERVDRLAGSRPRDARKPFGHARTAQRRWARQRTGQSPDQSSFAGEFVLAAACRLRAAASRTRRSGARQSDDALQARVIIFKFQFPAVQTRDGGGQAKSQSRPRQGAALLQPHEPFDDAAAIGIRNAGAAVRHCQHDTLAVRARPRPRSRPPYR